MGFSVLIGQWDSYFLVLKYSSVVIVYIWRRSEWLIGFSVLMGQWDFKLLLVGGGLSAVIGHHNSQLPLVGLIRYSHRPAGFSALIGFPSSYWRAEFGVFLIVRCMFVKWYSIASTSCLTLYLGEEAFAH